MTRCCGGGFGFGRLPRQRGFSGLAFGLGSPGARGSGFRFLFAAAQCLLRRLLFCRGTGQGGRRCYLRGARLFRGPFGRASIGCRPHHCCGFGLSFGLGLSGARGGGFGLYPGAMDRSRGGIVFQRGTDGGSRCAFRGLLRLAPGGFGSRLIGLDAFPQFGAQSRIRGGAGKGISGRIGIGLPGCCGRRILGSKPATLALGSHQVGQKFAQTRTPVSGPEFMAPGATG
jgi:hypothetical protein